MIYRIAQKWWILQNGIFNVGSNDTPWEFGVFHFQVNLGAANMDKSR